MVYFAGEMERRREFYTKHPDPDGESRIKEISEWTTVLSLIMTVT